MKALVLAGGGAKGAYQMGVWKALRRLNIKFDIVTGTSIGALNGALIVQDTYFRGMRLWRTTNFYKLFGPELLEMKDLKKAIKFYSKNFVKQDGIDLASYEKFIRRWLDVDKIYNSKVDYGVVTYNLSNRKPHFATKKKTKKDKLYDYIVASTSCFPAFDMKEIDGDKFIDGGYYDNLPINLAVDMGATEVIAVELDSLGIRRSVKDKDVKVTYIRPSCDLGSFLVFDKKLIKRNMRIGYNDTMKVFGKLEGEKYTFKKNDLAKNYKKYGDDFAYIAKRMIGLNSKRTINQLTSITFYKRLIKSSFNDQKSMNKAIELLGDIYEVPNYKVYDISMFNHILKMKFENYDDEALIDINHLKKLNFEKIVNRKQIVKSIYNFMLEPIEYHKEISDLSVLFPKEFIAALYLYTIS